MQKSLYRGERSSSWVTNYLILIRILIIIITINSAIIITIPINLIIIVTTVK